MIFAILTLLVAQLAGEVVARGLGLLVPGPVLGLLFLLVLLLAFPKLAEAIRPTASGLLSHLSLLFVPAGVGVVSHLDVLGANAGPLLAALVLSTLLAIVVGALVFVGVARLTGMGADD
jgi:putative effector of murein hydrolase LrgA (UPF0299 family)